MKTLTLITLLAQLFIFSSCRQGESAAQTAPDYFDCAYYHYFSDTAYPAVTAADSAALIEYGKRIGDNSMDNVNKFKSYDTVFYLLAHLPRIHYQVDTFWYDQFFHYIYHNEPELKFRSLNDQDIGPLISANAVIIGEVIDKKFETDSTKCLKYKLNYVIKVKEVIHSYFNLRENDLVLVKDDHFGYVGGCNPQMPQLFIDTDHAKQYEIGDVNVFLLDHWWYRDRLIRMPIWKKAGDEKYNYEDAYCPNAFALLLQNDYFDISYQEKLNDIKLFFKTKFKTHELD